MEVSPVGAGYVTIDGVMYTGPIRYSPGIEVELQAYPESGYCFKEWSDDLTGTNNPVTLKMSCDKTVIANFLPEGATGAIGNTVWEDKDADGIRDGGEAGINGVVVELYDTDDSMVGTTVTAGGGLYSFNNLQTGDYYLKFTYLIGGFVFSPMDQGSNDEVDSDANAKGLTDVFTLEYGQTDLSRDAGMYRPNTLSYSIPLSPGLQIISLPLIPEETQPQIALAGLDYSIVAMYLKTAASFRLYVPGYPPEAGFVWKDGLGYWIEMDSPGILTFQGTELDNDLAGPLSYEVNTGWNLIGYKSTITRTPGDYLASITGKYDLIYGYNDGGFFIVGPEGHNLMEPGWGYWIHITSPGLIYPPLEQISEDMTVQEAYDVIYAVPQDPRLVILDVRTPAEFNDGHIVNAANLDYYSATFSEDLANLDKTRMYIVYCGIGGRSGITLDIMKDLGFREAYNMLGGLTEWTDAGFPVVD